MLHLSTVCCPYFLWIAKYLFPIANVLVYVILFYYDDITMYISEREEEEEEEEEEEDYVN